MRVIGGFFKSRKLFFPKTFQTRPVTDRAKETIFNVLGTQCKESSVLDLFAGSGSLGLEALSRGAQDVCFVDFAKLAVDCIRRNLKSLALEPLADVLKLPVLEAIRKLERKQRKFSLIFVDPPHNKGLIKKVLQHLDRSGIVTPFGIVVVGHSNHEGLPNNLVTLKHERSIEIGQTFISFVKRVGSP